MSRSSTRPTRLNLANGLLGIGALGLLGSIIANCSPTASYNSTSPVKPGATKQPTTITVTSTDQNQKGTSTQASTSDQNAATGGNKPEDPACINRPVIGDIAPVQLWQFKDTSFPVTYSSPVAGDIDKDGQVEIVSIGSTQSYNNTAGRLSVIDAKTGNLKWQTSGIGVLASTSPVIVDLDGDGIAEIVATEFATAVTKNVVIIDSITHNLRQRVSAGACGAYCAPAVADINGDGKAEIVAGNVIISSTGQVIGNLEVNSFFIPTIADLIPERPGLEIIVNGNTVLGSDGKKIHQVACAIGTYPSSAVADLDKDGKPEHICSALGTVSAFSNTGTKLWESAVPKDRDMDQNSGAPNVGDFNGDGLFEVGVAGGDYYVVFDSKGNLLWKQKSLDWSSSSTGSTIFDFNGDGKVEVIYNDEQKLRIYDGSSGKILWETDNPSGTLWEYPLVVNIDDTPSAELVVSAPGLGGVRAFKDPSNRWVTSRRVWNQYSFYPEIVSDMLSVIQNPGFPKSGFRINNQGSARIECK